jgi:CRISPR-associated protein Cmr2
MSGPTDHGSMLLISLGPIQDFIQSARRCQDLWFGSWLLSELARSAGEAVAAAAGSGEAVVFPAGLVAQREATDGERPGVSNLIFALVPPGRSARAVADQAQAKMLGRLLEISALAYAPPADDLPAARLWAQHFHAGVAAQQLDDLMEWLWVSLPRTGADDAAYVRDRGALYARLGALKNTRSWTQPRWARETGVPKSALDGDRESVLDEALFDSKTGPGPELRRRAFGIKKAERLCAVGLLKRRGQELGDSAFHGGKPRFHSTSHIAAGPVLEALAHPKRRDAVRAYLAALEAEGLRLARFAVPPNPSGEGPPTLGGLDGSLLFASRMADHFEEDSAVPKAEQPAAVKAAERALATLRRAAEVAEPSPYYAFLIADGDRMGAAIDALTSPAAHHEIAKALNTFADRCRGIVEEHRGSLIFSGGDDVMALLPLHTALDCARALAVAFARQLSRFQTPEGPPTLSVGLGISHAREPMSEARRLAQRAEKRAKEGGKNALCVIVAKRSGADTELVGSWGAGQGGAQAPDRRLKAWVELLSKGALSAKTAHDLEEVADHYAPLAPAVQAKRTAEIAALCGQVLGRKRLRGGEEREGHGRPDDPVTALLAPVQAFGAHDGGPVPHQLVRQLSHELQIARLFAEAQAQARGEVLDRDGAGDGDTDAQGES